MFFLFYSLASCTKSLHCLLISFQKPNLIMLVPASNPSMASCFLYDNFTLLFYSLILLFYYSFITFYYFYYFTLLLLTLLLLLLPDYGGCSCLVVLWHWLSPWRKVLNLFSSLFYRNGTPVFLPLSIHCLTQCLAFWCLEKIFWMNEWRSPLQK